MKCNAPVDPETKIALKGDELKAALKGNQTAINKLKQIEELRKL